MNYRALYSVGNLRVPAALTSQNVPFIRAVRRVRRIAKSDCQLHHVCPSVRMNRLQ